MRKRYNNSLVGDWIDSKTAQNNAQAQADLLKAQTMNTLASQPAQGTNKWLIIVPIVVLLAGGITAFVLLKKKG
jgi:hypothetical protein